MAGRVSKSTMLKGVILDLLLKTKVLSYDTCRFSRPCTELEPNPQKFSVEALCVLEVHLVVCSRYTAEQRGCNTWSDVFFVDTQMQCNVDGHWRMPTCRLLGAMRTVQLYVLDQTIGLGNFSLDSTRWGRCICVGHITLPHTCSLWSEWCWVTSLYTALCSKIHMDIHTVYICTVTGANTMLGMGEILVKRDFSGIADAIPQPRRDFSPVLV